MALIYVEYYLENIKKNISSYPHNIAHKKAQNLIKLWSRPEGKLHCIKVQNIDGSVSFEGV